jgi:hypothetical protein
VQGAALSGGGLGSGELEEAVDAVLALDGEELVVQAHGTEVVRGHGVGAPSRGGRSSQGLRRSGARPRDVTNLTVGRGTDMGFSTRG